MASTPSWRRTKAIAIPTWATQLATRSIGAVQAKTMGWHLRQTAVTGRNPLTILSPPCRRQPRMWSINSALAVRICRQVHICAYLPMNMPPVVPHNLTIGEVSAPICAVSHWSNHVHADASARIFHSVLDSSNPAGFWRRVARVGGVLTVLENPGQTTSHRPLRERNTTSRGRYGWRCQ